MGSLDYSGWLANHNYNEPLLNSRVLAELAHVQDVLSQAKPAIYTNGDVLREPMLTWLLDAGVRYLRVTRYPHRAKTPATFEALHAWTRRAGLANWLWEQRSVRQGLALVREVDEAKIETIGPNILGAYNNRGGSVTTLPMLACVYPDTEGHANYVIGNLTETSFVELWGGEQMTSYRTAHARADWSLSPAWRTCRQPLPETWRVSTDAGRGNSQSNRARPDLPSR